MRGGGGGGGIGSGVLPDSEQEQVDYLDDQMQSSEATYLKQYRNDGDDDVELDNGAGRGGNFRFFGLSKTRFAKLRDGNSKKHMQPYDNYFSIASSQHLQDDEDESGIDPQDRYFKNSHDEEDDDEEDEDFARRTTDHTQLDSHEKGENYDRQSQKRGHQEQSQQQLQTQQQPQQVDEDEAIDQEKLDYEAINEELIRAIRKGRKGRVIKILRSTFHQGYIDPNYKDAAGNTAVLRSCESGYVEILRMLVNEFGGNASIIEQERRRVGLHFACLNGHGEIVAFLLSKNASLKNFQDCFGCTPLFYAAQAGSKICVESLLAVDAHVGLQNNEGLAPVDVASTLVIQRLILARMGVAITIPSPQLESLSLRTQVSQATIDLRCNSRKDRVRALLTRSKEAFSSKISVTALESSSPLSHCEKMRCQAQSRFKVVKADVQCQISSEKRCFERWERQRKLCEPIQIKRKVGLDDFIFYRLIGEGSFGEVHLVRIKEGVLVLPSPEQQSAAEQTRKAQEQQIEGESNEARLLRERLKFISCERENPVRKLYALKMIRKEALKKKKVAEYVETEKLVMQEVKSPFVAKLHLTFETCTHLFILMDYFPGGDLGRILEREMGVEEFQVKVWAAQIVAALEALHRSDIIYRDLKPENVVLDQRGNLNLIDFGLAKVGADTLTRSFCGTPIYLPPEIIGKCGHNRMVDWYSLGVIIYELLVGRPPYFSSDCQQLFDDIQTQPLRLPKSLHENSKSILIGLLRKNYKKRLGSERDAQDVKEHPWFSEINWDHIYEKKYECLKPVQLSIPTKPVRLSFNKKTEPYDVQLQSKWSFYNIQVEDSIQRSKTIEPQQLPQ